MRSSVGLGCVGILTTIALGLAGCGGTAEVVKKKKPTVVAAPKAPASPFLKARTSLPACDALVDQAERLISPGFGKRVVAALEAAAPTYGRDVAERLLPRVLEHGLGWAQASAGLCLRHVAQAAVSKHEYEKRMTCHGEAFARLRALASALEHADAGVAEWALPALAGLDEELAQCARPGVWQGYDSDPVLDAKLIQALADIGVLGDLQRFESLPQAHARAATEAKNTRSRLLSGRVLVYSVTGRDQESGEQALTQALELFDQAGSKHGHMLVHAAAARFYTAFEQPSDALAEVAEWIASCDTAHGVHSRTCANERRRASVILARAGRGAEALAEVQKALGAQQRVLGDLHPETLVTHAALAALELQFGSEEAAQRHVDLLLQAGPRVYGEQHPLVGDQLRVAARVAYKRGADDRALALMERALAIHAAAHGGVHRRLAEDHAFIGRIMRKRGERARAAQAYDQALAVQRRLLRGADPALASALKDAADAFIELGKPPPKVLKYLEQAMEIDTQLHGEEDKIVAIDMRLLGRYWAARGKFRKAYELHLESVKRLNVLLGPEHPETKRSTQELDDAVRGQGI